MYYTIHDHLRKKYYDELSNLTTHLRQSSLFKYYTEEIPIHIYKSDLIAGYFGYENNLLPVTDFKTFSNINIVSDEEKIKICRDKRLTSNYFKSVGLLAPTPVDDFANYCAGFPAFIKPRNGSSSVFAYKINNEQELETYAKQVPDYIIQPFITGTEYTIDVFCDFDGNPIYITPRIRLAVRAGEVLKTKIEQNETIIEEIKQLISDYKPCGAITVQLIHQNETGKNFYIEINPRYGGGAPLTMKAGANSAAALLKLLCGENVDYQPNAAEDGATYCRFDQSIRVD